MGSLQVHAKKEEGYHGHRGGAWYCCHGLVIAALEVGDEGDNILRFRIREWVRRQDYIGRVY